MTVEYGVRYRLVRPDGSVHDEELIQIAMGSSHAEQLARRCQATGNLCLGIVSRPSGDKPWSRYRLHGEAAS